MQTFIIPPSEDRTIASKGFSLLEILMALFIGTLILGLGLTIKFESSDRNKLEEAMEMLEKAVRFGVDEAVLRNRIVRLHFFLEEYPQQFTLEYASDENFVLSKKIKDRDDEENLSEEERKEQREILEEINKQFQPVEEFLEENLSFPEEVRIFGIGTTAVERLIGGLEASFFIYPSGEKDGALVILGTEEEMGTLSIEEFTMDFQRNWIKNPKKLEQEEDDDGEGGIPTPEQWKKSKELFEKWLTS